VNRRFIFVFAVMLLVAAGCGSPRATGGPPTAASLPLTVGLGYIPNVQFAQFYRADKQGYYRDAGLAVTFQNQIDAQLVPEIAGGQVDIGLSDGTSIIPAVSQGIPVKYAATIYAQFPSVVIARADSGIKTAADLRGKTVGIPGRYGSSWIMLQALLASADLTPDDVTIKLYPDFSQATALRESQVDAATGFANNEPVQLALAGIETSVLTVDQATPLPGQGLTVGSALGSKKEALQSFVAATLRAMEEITANPQVGLDDSIAAVPDLATDRATQLAILNATVEIWHSQYTDQHGLGAIDRSAWASSIDFMQTLPDLGVSADLSADQLLTEELLP
jgi:putative riboflavin transport system substrate-binding protein